jgi:hypothetical protein
MDHEHPLKTFARETTFHEEERARYDRLIRQARAPKPSPWAIPWPAMSLGLAGAAIAAFFALRTPEPTPVSLAMSAGAESTALTATLGEHVSVEYSGVGAASGTSQAPRIQWESGVATFSVTPGEGIDLRVVTPEAEVRVLGTIFDVERTALGTEVRVKRGKVGVTCQDGDAVEINKGESHTCLPTTAAGQLGRARALQAASAPSDVTLQATAAGLAASDLSPATRAELHAMRLEIFTSMASWPQALAEAREYLATKQEARRPWALQRAAQLSALVEGCSAAQSYLAELEAAGAAESVADLRGRCPSP